MASVSELETDSNQQQQHHHHRLLPHTLQLFSDPNFSSSTSTKKSRLPAFIYEDAAEDDNDDEDDDDDVSPRFKPEAAVRAAVDDAASVSSLDLENINANAEEIGEGGGGGGGKGGGKSRGAARNARMNVNTNCGICKRPPKADKAKDEEGVRKWRQPKTCKMLLGELYKGR